MDDVPCQHLLQLKYRDRAKERRKKYGTPEAIIPGWKKRLEREMAKAPPIPLVPLLLAPYMFSA